MKDKFFNLFNDNTTLITHCPVCSLKYDPLEAKILNEGDNAHLVYIKCDSCQSAILAVIMANNMGLSSVGLITDLTGDDVVKFKNASAISYDDVIDAHQFLNKQKAVIEYLD